MQCVENCDDPDVTRRVLYEQPVWQTLQMFRSSAPYIMSMYHAHSIIPLIQSGRCCVSISHASHRLIMTYFSRLPSRVVYVAPVTPHSSRPAVGRLRDYPHKGPNANTVWIQDLVTMDPSGVRLNGNNRTSRRSPQHFQY